MARKKKKSIEFDLLPKQKKALRVLLDHSNGIRQLLYGGGAGGGKSWLLCVWLIIVCNKYPRTRWVMARSKLKTLKQTTLNTFFDVCRVYGIKEGVHYKYNRQDGVITWVKSQSEIILKDLFQYPSDPDFNSLGSLEISGGIVDECNQVVAKGIDVLRSRIRYKLHLCHECADETKKTVLEWGTRESGVPYEVRWMCGNGHETGGLIQKMGLSCNPAKNWVFGDFYDAKRKGRIAPDREFIEALVFDNDKISEEYVVALGKLDAVSVSRLKFGEWEFSDNTSMFDYQAIQEAFNRKRKVKKFEEGGRCFLAVDPAGLGKDNTVVVVVNEELQVLHIEKLPKIEKGTPEAKRVAQEQAKLIEEIIAKYQIDYVDMAVDYDGLGNALGGIFEYSVHIVNNSRALNGKNYVNLRTQLYFRLSQAINNGEMGFNALTDEQADMISEELYQFRRTKIDQDTRITMTTKEQIKADIKRSPDYTDALAYAMYFFIDDMYL